MRVKSPKCGSLLYYCLAVACCCRVFDMMSVRCRPKDSWDILLRFEHSWPSHKPSSRMTLKMASDPFDLSISVSVGLHFLLLSPIYVRPCVCVCVCVCLCVCVCVICCLCFFTSACVSVCHAFCVYSAADHAPSFCGQFFWSWEDV